MPGLRRHGKEGREELRSMQRERTGSRIVRLSLLKHLVLANLEARWRWLTWFSLGGCRRRSSCIGEGAVALTVGSEEPVMLLASHFVAALELTEGNREPKRARRLVLHPARKLGFS
jgi:hypothetical protein